MTFGEKLRFEREMADVTVSELAAKLGCTTGNISQRERKEEHFRFSYIKKYADALHVPLFDLIPDDDLELIFDTFYEVGLLQHKKKKAVVKRRRKA